MAQRADEVLARVHAGTEEVFPAALVNALLDGEANPIKLLREYRGLTQATLATAAGINRVYLSQLERGVRTGSAATRQALARALRVDGAVLTATADPAFGTLGDAQN